MGTNYYAVKRGKKLTGRIKKIHIGKSSCGWKFLFQSSNELTNCFEDMKKILKEKYDIYDEYDRYINLKDFIELVEEKQVSETHLDIGYGLRFKVDKDGYEFTDNEFR